MMGNRLFTLFFVLYASLFSWTLRPGTYVLNGGNGHWFSKGYRGEVIITPQGENYRVTWLIGSRRAQVGIGILQEDILSVSFVDLKKPFFWGVATFCLGPWGELEGKWTSHDGITQKSEYLVWKNGNTSFSD